MVGYNLLDKTIIFIIDSWNLNKKIQIQKTLLKLIQLASKIQLNLQIIRIKYRI